MSDSRRYPDKLYEVLYENRPPTLLECSSLREGVRTINERIAQLRVDLADLEDQLQRHHSALAPVRRVPIELLGEIFRMATENVSDQSVDGEALLTLVLVCRTWRAAAYACGHLWSTLTIEGPVISDEVCEGVIQWFGRARGSRKTLRVNQDYRRSDPLCPCTKTTPGPCDCMDSNFLRLLTEGPPLHKLVLDGMLLKCVETTLKHLQQSGSNALSSLQAFDITISNAHADYDTWIQQTPSKLALRHLPLSITDLSISFPQFSRTAPSCLLLPIPSSILANLTTFSICCGWKGSQVLAALQLCTNLTTLSLNFKHNQRVWDPEDASIPGLRENGYVTLPKVHTLSIYAWSPRPADELLRLLRFPSLSDLTVRWTGSGGNPTPLWTILDSLSVFAADNAPPVRSLSINVPRIHGTCREVAPEDLTQVLRDIPNLVRLAMDGDQFDSKAFLELQQETDNGDGPVRMLAPTLEYWELYGASHPFHLESFLSYLKTRQTHHEQNGKVVFDEPMNRLRTVVLSGDWDERTRQARLIEAYNKSESTIREIREVTGTRVERRGLSTDIS